MSIPDPWKPLQNSSNFVLPRSLPTSGIVTVFVINLVVFVVLFIAFLVLRKFFPDFYIPYSRPKRLTDENIPLRKLQTGLRNRSETDLLMKPNRSYREYTSNRSSPNDSFNDSLKRTRATNMALSYDSIGVNFTDKTSWYYWLRYLWYFDMKDHRAIGIDAVLYFSFMRMCLILLSIISLLGFAMIIPINRSHNLKFAGVVENTTDSAQYDANSTSPPSSVTSTIKSVIVTAASTVNLTDFQKTCLNIGNYDQRIMLLHVLIVYIITAISLFAVFFEYKFYMNIKKEYKAAPKACNYSIKITNLPTSVSNSKELRAFIEKQRWPETWEIASAHLAFDVYDIEATMLELQTAKTNLAVSYDFLEKLDERPHFYLYGLGYVDSIGFFSSQVDLKYEQLKTNVDQFDRARHLGFGFVTFRTLEGQNRCLEEYIANKKNIEVNFDIEPAPEPSDILWENLSTSRVYSTLRTFFSGLIVLGIVFFWGFPVGLVVQVANLERLQDTTVFGNIVRFILSWPNAIVSLITQYLPTLILLLFLVLIVPVFRLFAEQEKFHRKSSIQKKIFQRYFSFLIFNTIFLSSIASQIVPLAVLTWSEKDDLFQVPLNILRAMASTFPTYGAFYMDYILNAALTSGVLGIVRIWDFLIRFVKFIFARTRHERAEINAEQNFYAFEYYDAARHMCMLAIGLSYSSLVPLILPVALTYFVIWYCVDKYNMLVVIRKNKLVYDMQGRLARYYYSYFLYSLIIYDLVMISIMAIQYAIVETILLLPLPVGILMFKSHLRKRFVRPSFYLTRDECARVENNRAGMQFTTDYLQLAFKSENFKLVTEG